VVIKGICDLLGERGGIGEPGGKLAGGELVEVGVGYSDVDDMGADVSQLEGEIVRHCVLHGEVPLLHVAGAGVAVDGVDALAETGVGRERNGRDGRAGGERECFVYAVLGFLLDILNEGELWRCKGRCDAGLVDEDDAEAGADDGFGRGTIGKTDARGDVAPVEFTRAAGISVLAEIVELLRLQVEDGTLIAELG